MRNTSLHKVLLLELSPAANGVAVVMQSRGPVSPLGIANGATLANALQLASMLFPVCPRAHQAAALNAAEALANIELSQAQAAARELLVFAEAIVGCIMRHDIVWRRELGRIPLPADCRQAREASDTLVDALFDGAWTRPGGGAICVETPAAADAVRRLEQIAQRTAARARKLLVEMPEFTVQTPMLSGAMRRDQLSVAPKDIAGAEETPRILYMAETDTDLVSIAEWFNAQISHLEWLTERLPPLLARVHDDIAQGATPAALTGTGVGVAMTARGRLRHALTLQDGKVREWKSAAPTDLNFAADGPVSQLAAALPADDNLNTNAKWLVQAFDPCAPCEVVVATERRHA